MVVKQTQDGPCWAGQQVVDDVRGECLRQVRHLHSGFDRTLSAAFGLAAIYQVFVGKAVDLCECAAYLLPHRGGEKLLASFSGPASFLGSAGFGGGGFHGTLGV